jgi:cytochrome P450
MESPQIQPDLEPYVIDPTGSEVLTREAAELRKRGPVTPVELPGGVIAWSITSAALTRQLLTDSRVSKDASQHWPRFQNGEIGPEWPLLIWVAVQNMFTAYGKEHTRLRRLVAPAFTARRTRTIAPRIEAIARQLLDEVAAAGASGQPVDLRESFAYPLPIQVIGELLGVAEEHRAELKILVDGVFNTTLSPEESVANGERLYAMMASLVAGKRAAPGDDLTSDLISQHGEDGSSLTEQELCDTVLLIISAGYDTTVNLIDQIIYTLLTRPDQLKLLREGDVSWSDIIEETLRAAAPVAHLPLRYAVTDIDLTESAGVVIRQGESILMSYGVANQDPAWHGDTAAEFDATRERHDHLAFGYGTHLCLGAPLARLEVGTGLPMLFDRFPNLRLACDPGQLGHNPSFITNGHDRLPVLLD